MLEHFTVTTFSGRIGETFRVDGEAGPIEVELVSAVEAQPRADGLPGTPGGRLPFSLVFHGPPEPVLPQRIYRFEHEGLGAFEIFIVPIGADESGMQYEAVFG